MNNALISDEAKENYIYELVNLVYRNTEMPVEDARACYIGVALSRVRRYSIGRGSMATIKGLVVGILGKLGSSLCELE